MEYLLKSSLVLTLFYIFYKIFLQNETFFHNIRIFLITGLFLSLVLPLIIIPKYITIEPASIPNNVISTNINPTVEENEIPWSLVVNIIYFTGFGFFLLRFLFQLGSLVRLLSSHNKIKQNSYYLIKTKKDLTPFSFFKYIVINDLNYSRSELKQILAHETIHVKQLHSFDHILSQLIAILLWFNPFSWLYTKEIQKNLEYIADGHARYAEDKKNSYEYLLLKTSGTNLQPLLASNFYNSLIKNRINMLHKKRSNNKMQFKFLLIIPVLLVFVFTFNTKLIAQHKKFTTLTLQDDQNEIVEIITKNTSDTDLKNIKAHFAKYEAKFKFSKLKRNDKGEITGIAVTIRNKEGNEGKVSQKSSKAITPIKIRLNLTTGELNIGNTSNASVTTTSYFISDDQKTLKNTSGTTSSWVTNQDGDIEVYVIDNDSIKNNSPGKTIITINKDGKERKIMVTSNMHSDNQKDGPVKVLVTTNGDTTTVKNIKIISTHDKNAKQIREINLNKDLLQKDENIFIFKSDTDSGEKHKNKIFVSSSDESPIFFLNGKKISEKEMKAIDPDKIKSINVYKGKTAIDKYGKEGENGVVEITTKN